MSWIELLLTAVALSMDAFAVATCKGLNLRVMNWKRAGIIGLFFGGFQALMPLLGWLCWLILIACTAFTINATAITTAINNISAMRKPATGKPSTLASSSCTVIASSGRHSATSNARTTALPPMIHIKSLGLMASRSPNR